MMGLSKSTLALALAYLVPKVAGHIALWDPAMYGWDPNDPNQNQPVTPLYNMTFDQWWFHGYINSPPAAGQMMVLPAGGTYHGQVACNKALTTYGVNPSQQTGLYACDGPGSQGGIGAMHTSDQWESPNPQDVKGCGIAIAYQSDVTKIQPEDFTVVTINYTCPWFKHVDFQIPADLPACPPGGCHCMWGWVHNIDAGSEQMYFNGFRCNVTGATNTVALPQAKIANKCPVDKTNCTIGAKQPHYWLQLERNNNPQGYYDPPFYNGDYGFMNGAQTDLFAGISLPITTTTTRTQTPTTTPTLNQPTVQAPTINLTPTTTTTTTPASVATGTSSKCKRQARAFERLAKDEEAVARHRARVKRRQLERTRKERNQTDSGSNGVSGRGIDAGVNEVERRHNASGMARKERKEVQNGKRQVTVADLANRSESSIRRVAGGLVSRGC